MGLHRYEPVTHAVIIITLIIIVITILRLIIHEVRRRKNHNSIKVFIGS